MAAQRTPTLEELPTSRVPAKDLVPDTEKTTRVSAITVELPDAVLTPEEKAALAEDVELAPDDRRRILAMHRRLGSGDAAAILGVPDPTDKKALKRAYFALSKEFHPDRFYGKRLGSFAPRLSAIFEEAAAAYGVLTGERQKRPSPPAHGRGAAPAAPASASATKAASPADYAAELFDRACQTEVSGDLPGALRLFASALRVDAPARYLRRAARCALAAKEVSVALEYARKAANLEPSDPSTARVLAAAFKAAGKLEQAEEVLVMAVMIPIENDQLMHELQHDLAELRRSRPT
jgi:tetratricopeptide (TPR) repeat protein